MTVPLALYAPKVNLATFAIQRRISMFTCPVGYFSNVLGSDACQGCLPGKKGKSGGDFLRVNESSACQECSAGRFSSDAGQTECQACSPGSTSLNGSSYCFSCPAGTMLVGTKCEDCAPGKFSLAGSAVGCVDCRAGSYSSADKSECLRCKAGKFGRESRQGNESSACFNCRIGTFSATAGSVECFARRGKGRR